MILPHPQSRGRTCLLVKQLANARAEEGETAFRFTDDAAGGVSGFWWVDRGFGYAVLAQGIDRPALLGLAEAVHRQVLTTPAAPNGRSAPSL